MMLNESKDKEDYLNFLRGGARKMNMKNPRPNAASAPAVASS